MISDVFPEFVSGILGTSESYEICGGEVTMAQQRYIEMQKLAFTHALKQFICTANVSLPAFFNV